MPSSQFGGVPAGTSRFDHSSCLDPETLGVMTILLGIFQLLLAIPSYYVELSPPWLLIMPVCIGIVFIIAGSFAVACEKVPNRRLLQGCVYSNVCGLVVALCAVCVYAVALHRVPSPKTCAHFDLDMHLEDMEINCIFDHVSKTTALSIATLLMLYNITALILVSLLSFSSLRELRSNRRTN
ncbi:membrane-spanning 4-domains subfamily A member 18 [Amia ocellicauda]|uniref:membrane-spanning 4-domains subfamily A member 18 n=1 Tax=Amia ocellicauda TaxID=2972642 RepID=UPI003463F73A